MDLRVPSGWFFLLLGVILCGAGVLLPSRAALTDINVNLFSGIMMLVFGGGLLCLSRLRS